MYLWYLGCVAALWITDTLPTCIQRNIVASSWWPCLSSMLLVHLEGLLPLLACTFLRSLLCFPFLIAIQLLLLYHTSPQAEPHQLSSALICTYLNSETPPCRWPAADIYASPPLWCMFATHAASAIHACMEQSFQSIHILLVSTMSSKVQICTSQPMNMPDNRLHGCFSAGVQL